MKIKTFMTAAKYSAITTLIGVFLAGVFIVYEQTKWDQYKKRHKCYKVESPYSNERIHWTYYECRNGKLFRRDQ